MLQSAWLSELSGADVWMKLEAVQPTGSFKVRGAANALASLHEWRADVKHVVTASAGNHGLALAWSAKRLGIQVRAYLPATVPDAKKLALERLGAELTLMPSFETAEVAARADAKRTGTVYISAYNDRDVIAGAGTVALEMLADQPQLDCIIVPLGGGGLLSGTAIVTNSKTPKRTITIGAELESSPVFTAALAAGSVVTVKVKPTLADGLAGNMEAGSQTFPLVRDLATRVICVNEPSIESAMRGLVAHERLIVEGSGGVGVAALLQGGLELRGKKVGIILSGRNVDDSVVRKMRPAKAE